VTHRIERIGDCELHLGDSLQVLPTLGRVDHVISDPPFEAEAHTQQRRQLGRKVSHKTREVKPAALPFAAITADERIAVSRLMAEAAAGWVLVFCQAEAVKDWRESLEVGGAKYRRAMIWVKPDGMPQFTGDRPGMGYESIVAAWAGAGGSWWNGGGKHGVFIVPKHDAGHGHGGAKNEHPTTKPIRLMGELVSLFSKPGDTVCDPFMGSGTTGVACVRGGRKFVGIEREPKYFDIACRRIEEAYKQPDMFVSAPSPKAEQLDLLGASE